MDVFESMVCTCSCTQVRSCARQLRWRPSKPTRFCAPSPVVSPLREKISQGRLVVAHNGFFGVGAPEALLVGVVALVVFGPQGLIEAAKGVASTIRSVQPAIQELTQATTEIRTSITKEVGIDSIQKEFREIEQTTRDSLRLDTPSFQPPVPDPTPAVLRGTDDKDAGLEGEKGGAKSNGAAMGENGSGFSDEERKSLTALGEEIRKDGEEKAKGEAAEGQEDIEKMRAQSAAMAWGGSVAAEQSPDEGTGRSKKKRLEDMTMSELQGELARRKEMIESINNLG